MPASDERGPRVLPRPGGRGRGRCQGAHWPAPSLNIPSPELASQPGESHPQALLERETLASAVLDAQLSTKNTDRHCLVRSSSCYEVPRVRRMRARWAGVSVAWWEEAWSRRCRGLPEPLENDLDLLIAGRHLGLMNVVEFHRLRQGEDVFLSVVAQPAPDIPLAGCEFQAPQNA